MTLEFDPSGDLADLADGLQSVTITRPGSSMVDTLTSALCRVVSTAEADASGGKCTASDVAWHLPASELSGSPQPGDVIVDGHGQRWTVLVVELATLDSRWRCICRNLAIVCGLNEYVEIEQATYAKGSGGADEPTWRTCRAGLRARIQPSPSEVKDSHQRQVTAARFRIFLAEDVPLDHTHRIKGSDGTVYRISGYRKADRIDALLEIDVVRVN